MAELTINTPEKEASNAGDGRHIRPAEFRALAVSHRRMAREDNAHAQVRGLRDLETGELFLIEERVLRTGRQ